MIGIGPGLGQAVETQNALYQFKNDKVPLVIDDALNILSKIKNGFL
jgi:NAD(P)H-hydrate repair Nnr-like enzyme with NAD(P)H-hydrate dehydratase domain